MLAFLCTTTELTESLSLQTWADTNALLICRALSSDNPVVSVIPMILLTLYLCLYPVGLQLALHLLLQGGLWRAVEGCGGSKGMVDG